MYWKQEEIKYKSEFYKGGPKSVEPLHEDDSLHLIRILQGWLEKLRVSTRR